MSENQMKSQIIAAGIGQMKVGEHWELSLRELAIEAVLAAVKDLSLIHI